MRINAPVQFIVLLSVFFFFFVTANAEKIADVIVVGAGVSGIGAASTIEGYGHSVVVLEARNRPGGRVWTIHETDPDAPVDSTIDLGAQWIHGGTKNSPLEDLVDDSDVTIKRTDWDDAVYMESNGALLSESYIDSIYALYDDYISFVDDQRDSLDDDISLGILLDQFLAQNNILATSQTAQDLFAVITTDIEGEYGEWRYSLSSFYYDSDTTEEGKDDAVLGYWDIFEPVANELDIRLNTNVTKIFYNDTYVIVTALVNGTEQTYEADYVVVTVSLGILKRNLIEFEPELSDKKKHAIQNLGFGILDKIVLQFNSVFWDPVEVITWMSGNSTIFFLNWNEYLQDPILIGFVAGNEARNAELQLDSEIINTFMNHIQSMYPSAPAQPTAYAITRWASDTFSYGSYSSMVVGSGPDDVNEFTKPQGRVYFAGEHTNMNKLATVAGAWQSGTRAADKMYGSSSSMACSLSVIFLMLWISIDFF